MGKAKWIELVFQKRNDKISYRNCHNEKSNMHALQIDLQYNSLVKKLIWRKFTKNRGGKICKFPYCVILTVFYVKSSKFLLSLKPLNRNELLIFSLFCFSKLPWKHRKLFSRKKFLFFLFSQVCKKIREITSISPTPWKL